MEKAYPIDRRLRGVFVIVGSTGIACPLILNLIAAVRGLDIAVKSLSDLVIMLCLYSFFASLGLLIIAWTLRTRLLISPSGLAYRGFDTYRTTWDNIEGVLITPLGFTLALREPMRANHRVSNAIGSLFGMNRRLTLIYHMQQWWHEGLEDEFRTHAPRLFEEGSEDSGG